MYIDYHRIQNGFQVTRFSLPFSALVYGLHIRAPLYPCSRSRWADKTSSKNGRAIFFSGHRSKYVTRYIYILRVYIFFCFSFLFSFVSNHFFFFFFLMPSCIHRSRYTYIFFFSFSFPSSNSLVVCFRHHYYQFIVVVVVIFNFVQREDFQREREEKEERERAREIHRIHWMSFARVFFFGRIVYSMFISSSSSGSIISIIPWFVKNSYFFFWFHRCGRTTRMWRKRMWTEKDADS